MYNSGSFCFCSVIMESKALFDFNGQSAEELSFRKGVTIKVCLSVEVLWADAYRNLFVRVQSLLRLESHYVHIASLYNQFVLVNVIAYHITRLCFASNDASYKGLLVYHVFTKASGIATQNANQ